MSVITLARTLPTQQPQRPTLIARTAQPAGQSTAQQFDAAQHNVHPHSQASAESLWALGFTQRLPVVARLAERGAATSTV